MSREDGGGLLELLRSERGSAAFVQFDDNGVVDDGSDRFLALLGDATPLPSDIALLW